MKKEEVDVESMTRMDIIERLRRYVPHHKWNGVLWWSTRRLKDLLMYYLREAWNARRDAMYE